MGDTKKILSALANLTRELSKEYMEMDALVEIRLKRGAYNSLMHDLVNDPSHRYMLFSYDALAEPQIFGITVLPEKQGR